MKKISLIIPTARRTPLLKRHLRELKDQTIRSDAFEVIGILEGEDQTEEFKRGGANQQFPFSLSIHSQEQKGPAAARNLGASYATSNILLFVGDDCMPSPNLLWRHYYEHFRREGHFAVQGLTHWHPNIPPDDFMLALTDKLGLQANWNVLKNPDGSWKSEAPSWFLTTNISISKDLFLSEGAFSEKFPNPAWEDIEFGFRLAKHGFKTYFSPDTLNYHFHKMTLDGFVNRQIMEGKSRLTL